jgi:recombination protein RecT
VAGHCSDWRCEQKGRVMNQQQTWPQLIEQVAPKFNEIANNQKLVTWAEESQFAIQSLQKNEALTKCQPHTVQNAVINVAAIGLTLNPALGYAYLVPEKGECNLKVSFKGLLKIATDSGSIKWVKAEIVKANDKFTYRGACTLPEHEMNPFGDRGATVGVYCVAKTFDGDYLVDVMSADEIAKIRKAAKQDYVWSAWPDEMAKKAIIKRASKQWPKTDRDDRLDRAIAVVNEYEGSEDIRQERDITPRQEQAKPVEKPFISNDGLNKAMAKIKAGELTIDRLEQNRQFTPEQITALDNWANGAEWIDLEDAQ